MGTTYSKQYAYTGDPTLKKQSDTGDNENVNRVGAIVLFLLVAITFINYYRKPNANHI